MDYPEISEEDFNQICDEERELMLEMEAEQSMIDDFLSNEHNSGSVDTVNEVSSQVEVTLESVKKRVLQELPPENQLPAPKRKKSSLPLVGYEIQSKSKKDPDFDIIKQIMSKRSLLKSTLEFSKQNNNEITANNKHWSFHDRIPNGDFQSITTEDGKRIYLDVIDESTYEESIGLVKEINDNKALLQTSYPDLRMEAERELMLMNAEIVPENTASDVSSERLKPPQSQEEDLWVNKYRPRTYLDLLSDESTNRTVLQWMKLWDKVVFGISARRDKKEKVKAENNKPTKFKFHNKFAPEVIEEFDELGRPQQKVVLLCGPPGLGKTTLAHIIATHAGYNPVEMNASDDRSVDSFRTNLENATSMRAVFGNHKRPNCLIIDEIDGAPAPSINYLVNLLQAKNLKTDTKKKKKDKFNLLRPIICICNDLYTPSLRPLRLISLLIHFPPTQSSKLAHRLHMISRQQKMRTDLTALLSLCNKTENDIRSCLSVLQFVSVSSGALKLKDLEGISVGQKDYQRSLFKIWQDIFSKPRLKRRIRVNPHQLPDKVDLPAKPPSKELDSTSLTARFHNVLKAVQSCGEYDKLTLGWFENYLLTKFKHTHLEPVTDALDWATMSDLFRTEILHSQSWSLGSYVALSFVSYHFGFASNTMTKLQYPSQFSDFQSKLNKANSILDLMISGMCLNTRMATSRPNLVLDILPYFSYIFQPSFRPVNVQLFTNREKQDLFQIVDSMIAYNVTYQQEKTFEGTYTFTLDPNIEEITQFSGIAKAKQVSYVVKQLIARETEMEKVRRAEKYFGSKSKDPKTDPKPESIKKPENSALPNHLKKLEFKKIDPKFVKNAVAKDFFGRVITTNEDNSKNKKNYLNADIWYKFKQGYSNAVRRNLKIKTFFT